MKIAGYGDDEVMYRDAVSALELDHLVNFVGNLDEVAVSNILSTTLSLLLISNEEHYGLVVVEALAMGVPVIYSPNCGAGDDILRSGINGFLVEPDNLDGIAFF